MNNGEKFKKLSKIKLTLLLQEKGAIRKEKYTQDEVNRFIRFNIEDIKKFNAKFDSEEKCQKRLIEWLGWDREFRCPRCKSSDTYYLPRRQLYQCKKCAKQTSITSQTIFHKTRTPLLQWFRLIFLLGFSKCKIPVFRIHKQLGGKDCNYKATWKKANKIKKALEESDEYLKLVGIKVGMMLEVED